ncbi:MAG: hypothetical protein V1808_02285 [Candidatus Daviesbacteria bacterium]
MKRSQRGIAHLAILLIIAAILAGGWLAYQNFFSGMLFFLPGTKISLSCDPLTLVSLKDLYGISGVKPISGEKCSISKEVYLLKLTYENYEEAEKAKIGLMVETSGTKKQIKEADLIINEGNSSAFYVDGQGLNVLVMLQNTNETNIKNMVLGLKNSINNQDNIPDENEKAFDNSIKSELPQIKVALETYFANNGTYPQNLEELVTAKILKWVVVNPRTMQPYKYISNGESFTIMVELSDGSLYQVSSEE